MAFSAVFDLADVNGTNGFRIDGVTARDYSGAAVSAGDVNGDGFNDVIIGAFGVDLYGIDNAGTAYVVFGHDGGFASSLALSSLNGGNGFRIQSSGPDSTGIAVNGDGDFNHDGLADIIIGASAYTSGRAFLVFGSGQGTGGILNLTPSDEGHLAGVSTGDRAGISVRFAGDVNGDGFDDVIIGAPYALDKKGAAYVVFGGPGTTAPRLDLASLDGSNGFRLDGPEPESASGFFNATGRSVSSAGDINGDGFDDLMIGASGIGFEGAVDAGGAFVVFGKSSPFSASIKLAELGSGDGFRINGIAAGDSHGYAVCSAGDINGDGFDDLFLGAFNALPAVVFGKAGGFGSTIDLADLNGSNGFILTGNVTSRPGFSAQPAGDVNGDGLDDLILGAYRADAPSGEYAGSSYVIFGRRGDFGATLALDSLDGSNGFRVDGAAPLTYSGRAVGGAGDINKDGVDDLIIGAPLSSPEGHQFAGSTYVVFGQSGGNGGGDGGGGGGGGGGAQAPVAHNDIFAVNEQATLTGSVLVDNGNGADSDADGDQLTVSLITGPAAGTLTLNADGTFFYSAADGLFDGSANSVETVSFTYSLSDGALSNQATATITTTILPGHNVILGTRRGDPLDGDRSGTVDNEDLISGGSGNDIIFGHTGNDILDGGKGNDVVVGGDGADRLIGGAGNDTYAGHSGADVFVIAAKGGADTISDYTDGEDRFDFSAVTAIKAFSQLVVSDSGTDAIVRIAKRDVLTLQNADAASLSGDDFGLADILLLGTSKANTIAGAAGDVSEWIESGRGNDVVDAGAGDDIILGGAGNDALTAGEGADLLRGEAGNDTMTGGAGPDRFVFARSSGRDVLTDFTVDEDVIDLTALKKLHTIGHLLPAQVGGDTVLTLARSTTITLQGVTVDQLSADDFLFS